MKSRIFILIIGISFLQISILFAQECYTLSIEECADYWYCQSEGDVCAGYEPLIPSGDLDLVADNRWSLVINSTNTNVETNEGNNSFHLGMCSECSDGYNSWEESPNMDPSLDPFIDLYFSYENGTEYNTDYKSIHSPDQLVIWDIAASIMGVDLVHLEWSFDNFIPLEYEIYFFDGNTGYNMRELSSISLPKEAFELNGNETNIKLVIGACAENGYTTHYFDNDNDGWGGEDEEEFCLGYAPDGWVQNAGDLNDDLFCESNLIDNCNVCDGFNQDMDCNGVCFGTSNLDECSVCGGNGIQQECGCGSPGEFGIPDGDCDCNGNVDDCAGVCGGTSTLETLCEDTDGDGLGNPGSETVQCIDLGRDIMSGCDLPDLHLYLSSDGFVYYKSSESINGFQFDVEGASILSASGGDAGAADFIISTNATTVIAFSFTGTTIEGCGTLVDLELDSEATGLNNIVVSDNTGNPIPFSFYQEDEIDLVLDCSDEYPDCSYNYYDCFDECGGPAEIDACDICDGPGAFYCGGGVYECSEADCPDSINYCLDLHSGANLISLYALPEDVSVQSVMSPLGENISGVITEGGACSQIAPDNWVGSQCSLSPEKGYWVILNSNLDLCLNDAYFTDPAILYGLHSGANLISFPSEFSVSVSDAFPDDIEVAITGVITEGGACSQISPENWVGSQCSFNGGMGYWVISMKSVAFTYDLSTLGRIKSNNSFGLTFPNGFEVRQSSLQAFYFIENINLGNEASNEGWILVYHGNTLVGTRQWAGEIIDIPIMGYDGNAYSKDYMETGDIPSFKYLNHYSGKLTNLYNINTPQWENNGLYLLGALEARNVVPQKIMLNAYPNPFNPITTLSFSVPVEGMLQLSIYNISGQMITTLARELKEPGIYEYIWDANAYPSGVYFARLNLGPQSYTQKLVLMK